MSWDKAAFRTVRNLIALRVPTKRIGRVMGIVKKKE